MASQYWSKFSSSPVKLVRFFESSRDRWKAKQMKSREERKLLLNQTRAVEKSREQWRERAFAAQQRVKDLEREVEDLKARRRDAPAPAR
jgi:hypothetical protein